MVEATQLETRAIMSLSRQEEEVARTQFLTFSLGGEVLAMEIRLVKEILQCCAITEVPLTPLAIRGVINLRGAVVPVIDLAVRFGGPVTPIDRRTCIVILEIQENEATTVMGIMVDHVSEVIELAADAIEPPPAFGNKLRPEFIHGVGRIAGKFVLILRMDRVLSVQELAGEAEGEA